MFISCQEKTGCSTGRVEDGFVFLRVNHLHNEINDVARGAELTGITLGAEDGEEILVSIPEIFAVVVVEFVDGL